MIQIAGTVRDTVNLASLDFQWQKKKHDLGRKDRNQELTPQERQIQRYQEDLARMREDNKRAAISNKLKSGASLTAEEIEYLKKNNPEALKEYEEIQREREAYRRQLRSCSSKEEAEQLEINKMNEFLTQAKTISNNPNIPKGEKLAQLEKLMKRLAGIREEHVEFTRSVQYQMLPEQDDEKKNTTAQVPEEPGTEAVEASEPQEQEMTGAEKQEQEMTGAEKQEQEMTGAEKQERETARPEKPEEVRAPGLASAANEIIRLIQKVDETTKRGSVDISI